jgi:hypothetical protein
MYKYTVMQEVLMLSENSAKKLLDMDVERIYLGNLSTVEADIDLPLQGENGTVFTWQSSSEYLMSNEGKVCRPHFGAGNRQIVLTLTATNQEVSIIKKFDVNILEKEYPSKVVSVYPITIYTKVGQLPELPTVAVVFNDLNEDAVLPVKWEEVLPEMVESEKEFLIKGIVKDKAQATANIVVTMQEELIQPKYKIAKEAKSFGNKNVKLMSGSDFYNQQQRFEECLLNIDDESMLYNFRHAAGLSTKGAKPMTGWDAPECNLKGHTTGHYLSGLALCYSATGNEKIKEKIDYMVNELSICQDEISKNPAKFAPGFLSGYDETQFDLLEEYTTYPTIWAPYYTLHKIMAGLEECYVRAGNEKALDILEKIGLWVYNRLSKLTKAQRDKMWSMYIAGEFGGINETLANLYMLTKDERYLIASKYFDNDKLYTPMKMKIDALGNLHANQHISQIIGCLRQFDATFERDRYEIAETFWEFVTGSHIYSIGGTGETEMFKPANQIAKYITEKTAESCASYNMLKLTGMLYEYFPKSVYMNYYEKTVMNHILSCGDISGSTGGSTYFMGLNPGAQKDFNYTENSCCHGTGFENHFKYGENIFAETEDAIIVNLFIPSRLKSHKDEIAIETKIREKSFDIFINVMEISKKMLKIRKPLWANKALIYIDGIKKEATLADGYYMFEIQQGILEISYECEGYLSKCIDDESTASVCWGPYVLAAVSEQKEYISLDIDSENVGQSLQHDGNLNFRIESQKFIPLSKIDKEHYHAYIKVK